MKKVFLFITQWFILNISAQINHSVDSLKHTKDISLEEVVVTATKVNESTPVAYSELSKEKLKLLGITNGREIVELIKSTRKNRRLSK